MSKVMVTLEWAGGFFFGDTDLSLELLVNGGTLPNRVRPFLKGHRKSPRIHSRLRGIPRPHRI
ncbi:MAG: hypothetical protein FI710_11860 [SAR202 cluster bacterium]|nr:hypothetical protein [SAR202 cluster bacterium]